MKRLIALAGVALMALGVIAGLAACTTSAQAAPAPRFPHGTLIYYTYDKGYGVVVATAGINVSSTKSFTINASPYNGATFSPSGGKTAFSHYLEQIGENVNGPVHPPASVNGLTLIATVDNVYTNHVKTYVYEGTGLDRGQAQNVKLLLENGSFFP